MITKVQLQKLLDLMRDDQVLVRINPAHEDGRPYMRASVTNLRDGRWLWFRIQENENDAEWEQERRGAI